MQKLTISIACSVGLHALFLLYWHFNHQTGSQQEADRLTQHTAELSEPIQFTLQPSPQQSVASDTDTQPIIQSQAQSPDNQTPRDVAGPEAASPNITTENITENITDTTPATRQDTIQRTAPDLFSIRQQIQQHAPVIESTNSLSAKCQLYRRMQGMAVDCQQERYAPAARESDTMSLAAKTQQQLADLLGGPALVSPAREVDASDTGNRIDANRNMVGDQLQGNQLRKAIMNQR